MQTINLYSLLDKKFIGADDLRKQLTDILSKLPKEKEMVITQNGKPKGVLVDIETYIRIKELKDDLADYDPKFVKKLNKALADVKKHGGIPAEKIWEELDI
ncbi:type II toxin-antitoxin system Phd/YefM family antitoxin [Candidatus Daviesbacteria bacterium]|nr:type II toxin-antitoxin system Phd/YefM family antitoxin [Candidatus Daviesbacteria bacterium]